MTLSIPHDLPRDRRQGRMVLSICLAAAVLPMTFSGGAIATPALGRAFGVSGPQLLWVVNAFMMVFGALPLIAGALADRIGRRRVFRAGLAGFVASGGLLALAPSLLAIDLLRGLQGLFAAATLAGGTAVLAQMPSDAARRRAFSLIGATFGLGLALGPVIGGWALETAGWRGVFLLPSLLALVSLAAGAGALPESRSPAAAPFDLPGALLFAGLLFSLTAWAILLPARGLASAASLGLLLAMAGFLSAFLAWERRCPAPLFDLTLLEDPAFLGVQALPVATCLGFVSLLVIVPVQLVGAGYSELAAGLVSMALSVPVFLVSMLLARFGTGHRAPLAAAGLVLAAAGLFGLGFASFDGPLLHLVPMLVLIGCGSGLPWGLMDGLAVEVAPREKAGVATGMFSTVRVASEGIVLALASAAYAGLIARVTGAGRETALAIVSGAPVEAALRGGVDTALRWLFWGLAVLTLLCAAVIARRLRGR
ncbi:MFS transporter [Poseidonocella sp. HB161398]|uniref:MFS transporter n=1 Tax=Poseidonocella sp. HB161398 TaxID=2320855 RepID=UPI0014866AD6|nr:MFS transporter [Poseidonocella sp. HB161398]